MNKAMTHHLNHTADSPLIEALQSVLANTYGVYFCTHNYHWNVEGPMFMSLHTLFQTQYTELFGAIDVIAERIRAIGAYALPFEDAHMQDISKNISNPLNKEDDANERAKRMLHNLILAHTSIIESCQIAKKLTHQSKDDETENLLVERIATHQTMLWMLRSSAA